MIFIIIIVSAMIQVLTAVKASGTMMNQKAIFQVFLRERVITSRLEHQQHILARLCRPM